jgi:hypothetical protein
MPLSHQALHRLQTGRTVAAELPTPEPDFVSYVLVIPQVPNHHEHPEAWYRLGQFEPQLRDATRIKGYELRILKHHRKYTDAEWGWDYDQVLADRSTRVKRLYVIHLAEIETILAPWLTDLSLLRDPFGIDSSLVQSPIDGYLDKPQARPHLWQW